MTSNKKTEHQDKEIDESSRQGDARRLRGRGTSIGVGGLAEQIKRRANAAAQIAGPPMREIAEQAQRLADEAREEVMRQGPIVEQAAREVTGRVRDALERAKPEVERLAHDAKIVGKAMKPQVSRVARDAADFAQEHESELQGVASNIARRVAPAPLRSALDAFEQELKHPVVEHKDTDDENCSST